SFSIGANGAVVVNIPAAIAVPDPSNAIQDRGIYIKSDKPVAVTAFSQGAGSAGATALIPLSDIPKAPEYVLNDVPVSKGFGNMAVIVALHNSTQVEITPFRTLATGRPAGIPFTITLNRGASYPIRALDSLALCGTRIRVVQSCKQIVVFQGANGMRWRRDDPGCTSADHVYEQAVPVSHWQNNYYVPPQPAQTVPGSYVVSPWLDNTQIKISGSIPGLVTLNRGGTITASPGASDRCISSDKAISTLLLSRGGSCNGHPQKLGDASGLTLSSDEGAVKACWWFVPTLVSQYEHYVSVIISAGGIPSLKLDGTPVNQSQFQSSSCDTRKIGIFQIQPGAHRLECDSPFLAYAQGLGDGEGYAFSLCRMAGKNRNLSMNLNTELICHPDSWLNMQAGGDSLRSVRWEISDGSGYAGNSARHRFGSNGRYRVRMIATVGGFCPADTLERFVTVTRAPAVNLGPDTLLCEGTLFRTSYQALPGQNVSWNRPVGGGFITLSSNDTLVLRVRDSLGCSSSDTLQVRFAPCFNEKLEIPNVFTPGRDGINDVFTVNHSGYSALQIFVYNRWGQLMYRFTLPDDTPWNGKLNNRFSECPEGVYYYLLEATKARNGEKVRVQGTISLIR
ncbi:MAG: gliding motility-associated C-terminal domain-containing protein, partial [Bacteroidetes bacterium]|nr:gliding motility-associated C-terminal domain-containing protein [Bacteroidota bacterium]